MGNGNKWAKKVGTVFNTRPRIAGKNTVWLERKGASQRFSEAFARAGAHVCLDGPTGAGKTSLVFSHLVKEKIRHVSVMATASLTWIDFCRRLVGVPTNEELTLSGDLELGIDKGLPVAKIRVSLGEKGRPIDDIALADKLATTWTEHDVAARLAELDAALVVDDLERANDDIIRRLTDLCKLLTQAYVSENAKLVLVGSGDIFQRIHREHSALDERLTQVSLGAFRYPSDSRSFMILGFNRLNRFHPWNSALAEQFEKRQQCSDAIWEAADGLPKSLNRLGYEIALKAEGRKGVSAHDILEQAHQMTEEHWVQYGEEFPEVLGFLAATPAAILLVKCLYEDGIARIHKIPHLVARLQRQADAPSDHEIEEALTGLVDLRFLVQTGKSGELAFVRDPIAAHTLGVVVRAPGRFKSISDSLTGRKASVHAAFPLTKDTPVTEGEMQPSEDA